METYLKLIWAYLKIGLFGFGGGYAMLSLIEREVVGSGWITSQMFTDIVAISQMTPGPIGINSATYIGYVVTGSVWGSIVATFTVVLPPFLLVLSFISPTSSPGHTHLEGGEMDGEEAGETLPPTRRSDSSKATRFAQFWCRSQKMLRQMLR